MSLGWYESYRQERLVDFYQMTLWDAVDALIRKGENLLQKTMTQLQDPNEQADINWIVTNLPVTLTNALDYTVRFVDGS